MSKNIRQGLAALLAGLACMTLFAVAAYAATPADIGVVVMHGKGGSPQKTVAPLAAKLQAEGFQVANLEMPWSARREYDVDLETAVAEVTRALDAMRANGAKKLFVAGHSQGGLFAALYGGRHPVDGIIAIAPGGPVDLDGFVRALGEHVARARQMVAEGKGEETASFADLEGRRGVSRLRTKAAAYLSWFDPSGAHTTRVFGQVREGTPVLYVAPTGDYPVLARIRDSSFGALPRHDASRMLEVEADHMGAASAANGEIAGWIRSVAGD